MIPENLQDHPAVVALQDRFLAAKFDRGEVTLEVAPENILEICALLKHELTFVRLSTVTAVDRYPEEPRFEIVYHLHSLARNERIRIKARIAGGASGLPPAISSVFSVWRAANWYEREVFDLFGIHFHGHPDMTRIMLPLDFEGHPLRKDFPVTGVRV